MRPRMRAHRFEGRAFSKSPKKNLPPPPPPPRFRRLNCNLLIHHPVPIATATDRSLRFSASLHMYEHVQLSAFHMYAHVHHMCCVHM